MQPKPTSVRRPAGNGRKAPGGQSGREPEQPGKLSARLLELWRQPSVFGLFLLSAILLAYQPAWHGGFIWDDDLYVTNNPLLSAPDGLWRIWFSLDSPSQYFPLTYTILRWEYALWGLNPTGYHLVNLLLHGVNAILVWRLLHRLGLPGARLAALIFALHPVMVESVAWITELKNILSLLFCLVALRGWIEFLERPEGKRRWYALVLAAYVLALLSKTTACTLPAALLLVAWLKRRSLWERAAPLRSPGLQMIPFLFAGGAMGLLAMWWERFHQGTEGQTFAVGIVERVLIASRAIWFYLGKLVWPVDLAFSYPRWSISIHDPIAYVWLVAGLLAVAALYAWRRVIGRRAVAALLYYVVTLAPVLGFVMLYTFRYTFVADHYQYAAAIGPIALASGALMLGYRRVNKPWSVIGPAVAVVIPLCLAFLTRQQSSHYKDIETLWRATLATNSQSFMAHNNLGNLLLRRGSIVAAIEQFQSAIAIRPDLAEARNNLGNALSAKGQLPDAIAQSRKALELAPDFAEARNNLGTLLAEQGNYEEAIFQYRRAVAIHPQFAEAHKNLGNTLLQLGRVNEAMPEFEEALRRHPEMAVAHNGLGNALLQRGQIDAALVQFNQAIELQPDLATAYNNRGTCLLRQGQPEAALLDFQKAVELRPNYPEQQNNLGRALLQLGRLDEAIARFRKAIELRPDFAGARTNLAKALAGKKD